MNTFLLFCCSTIQNARSLANLTIGYDIEWMSTLAGRHCNRLTATSTFISGETESAPSLPQPFPQLPFLLFKLPSLVVGLGSDRVWKRESGDGGGAEQEMRRAAFFVLCKMFKTSMTAAALELSL